MRGVIVGIVAVVPLGSREPVTAPVSSSTRHRGPRTANRPLHVRRVLAALAVVCILAACATPHTRLERMRAEALKKIDIADCAARGGVVRGVCMLGTAACVVPYADAGKPCTDKSQCKGRCLLESPASEPSASVTGTCEKDDEGCGCFIEVIKGKAQAAVCYD